MPGKVLKKGREIKDRACRVHTYTHTAKVPPSEPEDQPRGTFTPGNSSIGHLSMFFLSHRNILWSGSIVFPIRNVSIVCILGIHRSFALKCSPTPTFAHRQCKPYQEEDPQPSRHLWVMVTTETEDLPGESKPRVPPTPLMSPTELYL